MAKGKEKDFSTDWSAYSWDEASGCWYSSRRKPSGEYEYDYRYPDTTGGAQQRERTPRTPGPSILPTSDSSGQSHLDVDLSTDFNEPTTTNPHSNYSHSTETLVPATGASLIDQTSIVQPAGPELLSTSTFPLSPTTATASEYPDQYLEGGSSSLSPSPSTSASLAYTFGAQSSQNDDDTSESLASHAQNLSLGLNRVFAPSQPQWQAGQYLTPDSEDRNCQPLHSEYHVVPEKEQKSFWKVGRVFMTPWSEVARSTSLPNETHISIAYLGGKVYTEIRRFVIMRDGYGNCLCSPIHTYNGQGTLKPNLPEPLQHTIIYTGDKAPPEKSSTLEGGQVVREWFTKDPIQVVSEHPGKEGQLDPASRLNYSKVYTVEKYVKVINIGMVHAKSMSSLEKYSFVRSNDRPQAPERHHHRSGPGGTSGGGSSKNRSGGDRSKHGSGGGSRTHHTKDDTKEYRRQGSKKK